MKGEFREDQPASTGSSGWRRNIP